MLLIAALVGIGIAIQHIIFATPSSSSSAHTANPFHNTVTRCVCTPTVRVADVVIPNALHEEISIDPHSVYAKTLIASTSGLLLIHLGGEITNIRVFIAIENGNDITVVQPRTSYTVSDGVEYLVYVPRSVCTIILVNEGSSKALINVDIEFR